MDSLQMQLDFILVYATYGTYIIYLVRIGRLLLIINKYYS